MHTKNSNPRRFSHVLPALFLLLALVLVACGGEEPAGTEALPTAAAEVPTESVAEATDEPAVEPTEETAPEPTMPPAATEAPTEEPDAPLVASGECSNAFFPVVDGRVYTYSTSISGFGVSNITQTYGDVTDNSFTITIDAGEGEPFANTWTCSDEGILSPDFSQLPGGMEGVVSIDFVEAEGVTLPAEEMFQPGETWTTRYVAEAVFGDADTGEMTMVQTMEMTNTVVGIEAVSVPAGDFDEAVRVDTTGVVTMEMGDTGMATSFDMNYTSWYVRDVGMVRQEFASVLGVEGAADPSVTELISYEDQ